jgi:hypothetical protein
MTWRRVRWSRIGTTVLAGMVPPHSPSLVRMRNTSKSNVHLVGHRLLVRALIEQ